MTILSEAFLKKYKNIQPNWGFNGLGYVVYKRTYSRPILDKDGKIVRTEQWWETVSRCIEGAQEIGAEYTREEAEKLFDLVFNLKCNFGGRMLWQLGTDSVRKWGLASLLNCWFVSMREQEDFCFLFEHLMMGGGVGFSVKREDIHDLPRIKKNVRIEHKSVRDADFIVPDSREGWVNLLRQVLNSFFITGKSFTHSTILIRGAGEIIKAFGGTASGPLILIEGVDDIVKIFQSREGKKLRSIDVLDICNIIGGIVVSGNVRRSAQIAIGDPDDFLFLRAKRWDLGNIPNWRMMSNNSIYIDDFKEIDECVWDGYKGNGEPYGFINIALSRKYGRLGEERTDNCEGFNPCVTKDTWIMTSEGSKQVKELINKSFIAVVNGKEYKTLSNGFWKTGDKEILKITTAKGFSLKLTGNHKILAQTSNGDSNWVDAANLNIGSKVALQKHDNYKWGKSNEFNKGWLLGNLVGDGTFDDKSAILSYWGDNNQYMLDLASEMIKDNLYTRGDLGSACYNLNNKLSLGSTELKKLANSYGIYRNDKYNIDIIEQSSSSLMSGFICGLFDADGSVQGNTKKGISVRLTSTSQDLLHSTQRMLLKLGIVSSIYNNRALEGDRLLPDGHGGNKEYFCQAVHELVISKENISIYNKKIGFYDKNKQNKLDELISSYKRSYNREYFTDKIVSIEAVGTEDVYDVTIDKIHCFDANGFTAHNCAEISLADGEACNLCELYLNNITSKEELISCAKLLYKTQKAIWTLPALYEKTNKIVKKNMRIGLGVTGICQSQDKMEWLDECYKELRRFDKHWSKERGWPESIKLTTVKPSGTLSLLSGSTPGGHPAYSAYYIRRVRMAADDPIVSMCREHGYHIEYVLNFDGTENHNTVIVEFPCKSDKTAILSKNMTAIQQLEIVKRLQSIWSDNSVSVTIYYKSNELDGIKNWLQENYKNNIKSVSFLLHAEHGFKQAPYEEIDEVRYEGLVKNIKPFKKDNLVDSEDQQILDSLECGGGHCPIK